MTDRFDETKDLQVSEGFAHGHPNDLSSVIGEAMWVLGASERYRSMTMSSIRDAVFEPILKQQCIVFQKRGMPMAVAFWAMQSSDWTPPETKLLGMSRQDWSAGTHPAIVEIIVPFGEEDSFSDAIHDRLSTEIQKRASARIL